MDELIAFVAARLDEDEAIAREAAGLTENWIAEEPAIGIVLVDGEPLIEGHITGLAAHIARHDPARVLREVAAKREHLRLYDEAVNGINADLGIADALKEVLRADAATWSDHPDYGKVSEP